jgi:polyisoprenoid-binding protein YceI
VTSPAWFRRRRTWLIAIPVVVLLVVVAGPFVYIHFLRDDPPPPLTFSTTTTSTSASAPEDPAADDVSGTWTVAGTSVVGYRITEVLFGQEAEAVGRTSGVTGDLTIDGTTVTAAGFTADMTTVTSDETRRDNQFQGRIMDTATYPTATFELTQSIDIGSVPADLEEVTFDATGELTLHGTTKEVTFTLTARRNGASLEVNGAIPIAWVDYGIPEPSFGPAAVQDHGLLEFLLVLDR